MDMVEKQYEKDSKEKTQMSHKFKLKMENDKKKCSLFYTTGQNTPTKERGLNYAL